MRSYGRHVGSIEHHRYHVVGKDLEKLLCHVVLDMDVHIFFLIREWGGGEYEDLWED